MSAGWLGCFSCALESGLRIYNTDPLLEKLRYGKTFNFDSCLQQELFSLFHIHSLSNDAE